VPLGAGWFGTVARFYGQHEHSIDPKGRLILPAKFRVFFELGGAGGFLTQESDGCLGLYTPDEFESKSDAMQARAKEGPDQRNMVRLWASKTAQVEIDRQGRLAIPAPLRDYAALATEVLVMGVIERVELWEPARWAERIATQEENLMAGGIA
jgi:MraZ protein